MTTESVHVRVRWSDARTEKLDPMPPGVETQEIQGLGQDLRWYSFRHVGEIDEEGFLIFVQALDPISLPSQASSEIVVLSAPCSKCGGGMEIHCWARHGFGYMRHYAVECPHCLKATKLPLPDDIVEVLKADGR
jgi:hypothetical protein